MIQKTIITLLLLVLVTPAGITTSDTIPQKGVITKKAEDITLSIKIVETGGKYEVKGASGEIGAYQFMPSTYKSLSLIHFGTSTKMTPENQDKLAYLEIESMVKKGYTVRDIALTWNQGNKGKCKSGINSKGVKYDSCAYAEKVIKTYNKVKNV